VGLHFQLADWLGSRRVQTDYAGNTEETCTNMPFGDNLSCPPTSLPTAEDATDHHFTDKERDAESGNDYFGARYYGSTSGRFLSPDWSGGPETVPYAKMGDPQSLNLYAYVDNNPISGIDLDGHDPARNFLDQHQAESDPVEPQTNTPEEDAYLAIMTGGFTQGMSDAQDLAASAPAQQQTTSSTANANPNAAAEGHQYDLVVERTNKLLGTDDAADHIDPNGTLHGGNYAFGINENDKSDATFKSALNKALGEADGSAGAHGGLTPPTHRVGFSTSLHHDNDALHVDHFNGAKFPIGTLLHAIVDVGIGSAFYGSTRAFSYAGVQ
jgi:RHS repeat-associated protein